MTGARLVTRTARAVALDGADAAAQIAADADLRRRRRDEPLVARELGEVVAKERRGERHGAPGRRPRSGASRRSWPSTRTTGRAPRTTRPARRSSRPARRARAARRRRASAPRAARRSPRAETAPRDRRRPPPGPAIASPMRRARARPGSPATAMRRHAAGSDQLREPGADRGDAGERAAPQHALRELDVEALFEREHQGDAAHARSGRLRRDCCGRRGPPRPPRAGHARGEWRECRR